MAVVLGGIGLVAIGASGLVAELLGRLFGAGFVAGDLPGVTYTAQRCAEFLEYFPDAGSCAQAAALHHWGEVVEYRVAVGVVGAVVLGAYLLWRRRPDRQDPRYLGVLPDGFSATVATSLYGVAAAALALLSQDAFLSRTVTAPASGSAPPSSPRPWRPPTGSRCTAPSSPEPGSARPRSHPTWQNTQPSHPATTKGRDPVRTMGRFRTVHL